MSKLWKRVGEFIALLLKPRNKQLPHTHDLGTLGVNEEATDDLLQEIANSVVKSLGFRASMVSIVRSIDGRPSLSVRSFAFESALSKLTWAGAGKRLEGTVLQIGEKIADQKLIGNYVSLDEVENLGVRAIKEELPYALTGSLYELFAPRVSKEIATTLQTLAQMHVFVTIPFRDHDGNLVGNLFAGADSREITKTQIESLTAFSSMATLAIYNGRLLQESEALRCENQERLALLERKNRQLQAIESTVSTLLESTLQERKVFQRIVDGVVMGFDFRAAFLSVVDRDTKNALILPVRAFSIHPDLPGKDILEKGQRLIGKELVGAFVYINDEVKEYNLGVKIILDKEDFGRTDSLKDLWYPAATEMQCGVIQGLLGMKSFATIPFWLIDQYTDEKNLVGNLYVGTNRENILDEEINVLSAFALQASIAIRNAKLYLDAQKIASLGSLSSNVAHQLNNLIGKMSAWIQQIQEQIEIEALDHAFLADRLQRVGNSLNIASETVARFRKGVKAGSEDVRISPVNVNEVISFVLETARIPDSVNVLRGLEDKLPLASAVQSYLVEILEILISNALDAMDNSGILTITSRNTGRCLEVAVRDSGKGIADVGNLFKLGSTTKERGLGYGLWWAKTSLCWIEGDIRVESEIGKGSIFTISIPIYQGTTAEVVS